MVWTVGKDWKAEAEDKMALENKLDVLRLLGSSLEAKDLREKIFLTRKQIPCPLLKVVPSTGTP